MNRRKDIWRQISLKGVVAVSILPLVLVLFVYLSAIASTHHVRQFDDWWSRRQNVEGFVHHQFLGWQRFLRAVSLERRMNPELPDAGIVRLDLPRSEWDGIGTDPQSAFGVDIDGSILRDGAFLPVELRVRGDTSVHWTTEKISFTLKTPRNRLYRGHRRLAFSVKEVLLQQLTAELAVDFDLLAPSSDLASVFFNDRFYGVHRVIEVPDESFLRRLSRLPGDILRGDTAERSEYFKNVPRNLFENPYIWDRTASGGGTDREARQWMGERLREIQGTTLEDRIRLLRRFDLDEVERFVAYLLVVGDPYHLSDIHNHFWYRDPSDDRMHPIPWDVFVRPLVEDDSRRMSTILRSLLREPQIMDGALRYIHERQDGGDLLTRIADILEDSESRHANGLAFDRLREGAVSAVGEPDSALALIESNLRTLEQWTGDARVVENQRPLPELGLLLDLETRGYVGADLVGVEFDGIVNEEIYLHLDVNRSGRLEAVDPKVELQRVSDGSRFILPSPERLLAGVNTDVGPFRPTPVHYRFFVSSGRDGKLPPFRPVLRHGITGEPVVAETVPADSLVSLSASHHPWDLPSARKTEATQRVLRGIVDITEDWIVAEHETIVVEAGTEVRIAPDASLFVFGRIEAEGAPGLPIIFGPMEKDRPWGTLALVGEGAAGSRFSHCRFERGSGGQFDGVEFKGMVSIHRVSGVEFDRCQFVQNLRTDDALNAVHSQVRLESSEFLDANADAVDFDISSGLIRGCTFRRSGNDAIDLMTSDVKIIDNFIIDSADKGISVGEASRPLILGNVIRNCSRGIEVKDSSEPWIIDNQLQNNDVGVLVMRKNWRYGEGGFAKLISSRSMDNKVDVRVDADSRLSAPHASEMNLADSILKRFGVRPSGLTSSNQTASSWTMVDPEAPRVYGAFREDFRSFADGWEPRGAGDRLAKRDRDLVLELTDLGGMARDIDWRLDEKSLLILDLASEGLDPVVIRLEGSNGGVEKTVYLPDEPGRYSLVAVDLPAGDYSRIELESRPQSRRGRLSLHQYWLEAK